MLPEIIALEGHIQIIYLAVYPHKLMLLDGCCHSDVPMVLDYIKSTLERPVTDLKVVMVTHMHPDHAGGAQAFKEATGCYIVSADKRKQWYSGIAGRTMHKVDLMLAYYFAKRLNKPAKNLWYPASLDPDFKVTDGDSVPYFEDWQVLETPGHTDRDLSLYHEESGQIYTADLIIKLRHKFVSPIPIYYPDIYRQSLRRVKALQPKTVMMAHGGARHIEPEVFDHLIEHAPKTPFTIKRTIQKKIAWWVKTDDAIERSSAIIRSKKSSNL